MLTASCTRNSVLKIVIPRCADRREPGIICECGVSIWIPGPTLMRRPGMRCFLFHHVVLPVLDARDLAAVPLVDAVVELRAEVVVLGPHDRPAAQAFGIDREVLHRAAQLRAVGARAGRL